MFSQATARRCKPSQAKRRRARAKEARRQKFIEVQGIGAISTTDSFEKKINFEEKLLALPKELRQDLFQNSVCKFCLGGRLKNNCFRCFSKNVKICRKTQYVPEAIAKSEPVNARLSLEEKLQIIRESYCADCLDRGNLFGKNFCIECLKNQLNLTNELGKLYDC